MKPTPSPDDTRRRWFLGCLVAIALFLGALMAWDSRYVGDPDGISYFNIAEQVLRGNYAALDNLYWSPLYPIFLALLMAILHPAPENGLPVMHLANFLMFVAATGAFVYFLSQWMRLARPDDRKNGPAGQRTIIFWAWCLFLWVSLRVITVIYPLPDMQTFACLLLAAGLCCRIASADSRILHYALLGLVLGVGYIGKFAVAPFTAVLFALMFLLSKSRAQEWKRLAVAAAVFGLFAAPEILAASRRAGKLSFGEAGNLNLVWHVKLTPFPWTGPGGVRAGDTRFHVLNAQPVVYEFSDPSGSTLPYWYDPAYWLGDAKVHVTPKEWVVSFWRRTQEIFRMLEDFVPFFLGLAALFMVRRRAGERKQVEPIVLLFGAWSIITIAIFMPVHIESRYIATSVFLLCLVLYRIAERAVDWSGFSLAVRIVGPMMLLPLLAPTERAALHFAQAVTGKTETSEFAVMAAELHNLGVKPGDRIAVAGYLHEDYYAQIARVQIAAQVCDNETSLQVDWHDPQATCHAAALFQHPPDGVAAAWDALRRSGFRAVVTRDAPRDCLPSGWRPLGERYAVLIL